MNQPPQIPTPQVCYKIWRSSPVTPLGWRRRLSPGLLDGRVTRDQQRRNWFAPITIADDVDNPDCRFPDYGMGFQDDKFWADYLGTDPADWDTIGVSVLPHVGLRGYSGLWCFRRNRRAVVSAPAAWVPRLTEMIVERTHDDDLMQDTFWARVLQHDFERAIGPAFQG